MSFVFPCVYYKMLTSQRDDLVSGMHDRGFCTDRSSNDIVCICKVDNDDFFFLILIFSSANESVTFHSERVEADSCGLDPDS